MKSIVNFGEHIQTVGMLVALCLLITMFTANVLAQNQNNIELDPAPLMKLLHDVLLSIVDEEYDKTLRLCEIALNISLPTDIGYAHKKLYRNLAEISSLLKMTKDTSPSVSVRGVSLDHIYRLYIAKDELNDSINEYLNRLSRYFIDPSTRYLMSVAIKKSVESLNLKIDLEVDKHLQIYMRGAYEGNATLYVKLPEKVYGGEKLCISLYVNNDVNTSAKAFVRITTMFGHVITRTLNLTIPLGTWVDIEVDVPRAEELEAIGISPLSITRAKVYVLAIINVGNTVIYGYTIGNTSIIYEKPSIKFNVPGYVYPGQPILITIESKTQNQLNLSVYLDIVSNESMVLSTIIPPGITNITIVLPNISTGYHNLIFITHAIGRYITSAYTYVFAVSRPRPSVAMSTSDIVVFPLTKLKINLYVDTPIPYAVTIYINNRRIAEGMYINSSRIEIEIEPPMTLLIWRYSIVAEVKPIDAIYDPSFKEGYAYVLNLPALIAIPGLLSIALATPSTSKYLAFSLRFAKTGLRRITYRTEGLAPKVSLVISSYNFRKPKLINLYKKFILIVSKYVEPPQKSETLREFYNRFKHSTIASTINYLVKTFLDIYEEDLYSKHSINEVLAKDVIERLDNIEST